VLPTTSIEVTTGLTGVFDVTWRLEAFVELALDPDFQL
jgi:hypothetical protein